ncbi:hypothetical protein ASD56_04265 [Microbacterium sp. Root166]|nr:hypothetical protein ASD56_04265 [Microbacterium sp. Root166]
MFRSMSTIALYVNGGRFELADHYTADDLGMYLRSPKAGFLELQLAHGGTVRFGITPGLAWAVEEIP